MGADAERTRSEDATEAARSSAEVTGQSKQIALDLKRIGAKLRGFSEARKKLMRQHAAADDKR